MTNKTIKELAEEFHVSKQAIRKRLTDDFRANYVQTVTANGVETLVVTYEGYLLLNQHFSSGNNTGNQQKTVASNTENQIIDLLHEQIKEKDIQIKQMQRLLDQQQQLTLQANKQIERLEAQKRLPAVSGEQTDQEPPTNQTADKPPEEVVKATDVYFDSEGFKKYMDDRARKNKKWWHFFRKEP